MKSHLVKPVVFFRCVPDVGVGRTREHCPVSKLDEPAVPPRGETNFHHRNGEHSHCMQGVNPGTPGSKADEAERREHWA